MKKSPVSESGFFNPRVVGAFALCSFGVLLGMFSLAATPPAGLPAGPTNSPTSSTFSNNANRLPRSVPRPADAQFSVHGPNDFPAAGSWSIVDSPNSSAQESNRLWAVTCLSASDCWAVGDHYPGNAVTSAQTLIERWDGNSWSIVNSPNTGTYNTLYSVTCVSSSDCWAVGFYNGSAWQTLTLHWDGTSWTVVSSPNAGSPQTNILLGVTCVSSSDCWAVGYATNGTGYDSLIEHWDGSVWAMMTAPTTGIGQSNRLLGVTCVSTSDCWAAGYSYVESDATARTLIERWDGMSWAIVNSPNALTVQNYLVGVTCVSSADCWAVGYTNDAGLTSAHQTLIERWDGTAWAIVPSANTSSTQHNWLTGVTCASASECWAVGYYIGSTYLSLIEKWDGTSWTVAPSPNSGSSLNLLYGVTCGSASDCWAVGVYSIVSAWQTLTVKYTAPLPPIPTSVVSRKTHGNGARTFDINLPLTGTPGIECRAPLDSSVGSVDYKVVFTFPDLLTNVGSVSASATGSTQPGASSGVIDPNDAHHYIVNLSALPNAQFITVTLTNAHDNAGRIGNIPVTFGLLVGDANASGRVDSGDVFLVRQQSLQDANASNFRDDINSSGRVDSGDVFLTRQQSLTALP